VLTIIFSSTGNKKQKETEHNYNTVLHYVRKASFGTLYIQKARKRKTFRKKRIRKTDTVWNVASPEGRSWRIKKKNTVNKKHTEKMTECQLQGKNSLWEADNPFAGRNIGIQNGLSAVEPRVSEVLRPWAVQQT